MEGSGQIKDTLGIKIHSNHHYTELVRVMWEKKENKGCLLGF